MQPLYESPTTMNFLCIDPATKERRVVVATYTDEPTPEDVVELYAITGTVILIDADCEYSVEPDDIGKYLARVAWKYQIWHDHQGWCRQDGGSDEEVFDTIEDALAHAQNHDLNHDDFTDANGRGE